MHMGRIQIGEHLIDVQTDADEVMNYLQVNFTGKFKEHQYTGTPALDVSIRTHYGKPFESFEVGISTGDRWVTFCRTDYKIKVDMTYRSAEISVFDNYALKHALMNLYSAFIVHHHWGLLLHSSCVIDGDGAYVFSGHSGAGKSTIAKLSYPRPLLSDEATIVKVSSEGVRVYDSPFRSDTLPCLDRAVYRLAAIHLIHQSGNVKKEQVAAVNGMMELLDKVFYWAYDANQTKRILKMCHDVVNRVPIYDLYFPKNDTFWEAIS